MHPKFSLTILLFLGGVCLTAETSAGESPTAKPGPKVLEPDDPELGEDGVAEKSTDQEEAKK